MKQTGLHFVLIEPGSFLSLVERLGDDAWGALQRLPGVGTLRWPPHVELPMLELLRDVVLRAYSGSAARAWSTLRRPYQGVQWPHPRSLGHVTAEERERFLGGRAPRLLRLPSELTDHFTPEVVISPVRDALRAFETAPPEQDLLLVSVSCPAGQRPASRGGRG